MSEMLLPLTLPSRRLLELAVEVLKEFATDEVDVAPLLAAAAPTSEARALPELRFWPEESRVLLSELSLVLLSVLFVVWVVVLVEVWVLPPRTLFTELPVSCACAKPNASAIAVARIVRFICYSPEVFKVEMPGVNMTTGPSVY